MPHPIAERWYPCTAEDVIRSGQSGCWMFQHELESSFLHTDGEDVLMTVHILAGWSRYVAEESHKPNPEVGSCESSLHLPDLVLLPASPYIASSVH